MEFKSSDRMTNEHYYLILTGEYLEINWKSKFLYYQNKEIDMLIQVWKETVYGAYLSALPSVQGMYIIMYRDLHDIDKYKNCWHRHNAIFYEVYCVSFLMLMSQI